MERMRRSWFVVGIAILLAACSQHGAVPDAVNPAVQSVAPQRLPGPRVHLTEYRVPSRYKPTDRILLTGNGAVWYTGGFAGIVRFRNGHFASPQAPPTSSYAGNFQDALATDGKDVFGSDGWASSQTLVGGFNVAAIGPIGNVTLLGGSTCSPGGPYLYQMQYDPPTKSIWALLQDCESNGEIFVQRYPGKANEAKVLKLPGTGSFAVSMAFGKRDAFVYGYNDAQSMASWGIFQYDLTTRRFVQFTQMPPGSNAVDMIALANGDVWFTDSQNGSIDRLSGGVFTQYRIPGSNPGPYGIDRGCDGALWFTQENANAIGRMTTRGVFSSYPLARGNYAPQGIVADTARCGSAHVLWFTQLSRIGKATY